MRGQDHNVNLDDFIREHGDIEQQLADPAVHADQNLARTLGKRYAHLRPIVEIYREIGATQADLTAALELAPQDEAFAKEAVELEQRKGELEAKLQKLLIPRDPNDDKDVILEIKRGRAAKNPPCSPAISSGCTPGTPSGSAGRPRSSMRSTLIWVDTRTSRSW
jgi:Protein chain release factor A